MLIGFQNLTFEFGARVIVEDATWHINPGERIGLIGYNGTGKSTLLKVLVGQYLPSKGSVEKGRETTIGYLHQDLLSFDTVAEYAHLLTKAAGQAMRDGKQDLAQSLGEQAAQVSIYALEFLDWQKSNPDKVHYPD